MGTPNLERSWAVGSSLPCGSDLSKSPARSGFTSRVTKVAVRLSSSMCRCGRGFPIGRIPRRLGFQVHTSPMNRKFCASYGVSAKRALCKIPGNPLWRTLKKILAQSEPRAACRVPLATKQPPALIAASPDLFSSPILDLDKLGPQFRPRNSHNLERSAEGLANHGSRAGSHMTDEDL